MSRSIKIILNIVMIALVLMGAYYLFTDLVQDGAQAETPPSDLPERFVLEVIDCGQGDCILAQTPQGHCILIDTGDGSEEEAVLSALRQVSHIDLLIVTHPHADHIGNLQTILERLRTDRVMMSDAVHTTDLFLNALQTMQDRKIPREAAVAGKSYTYGKLVLDVLGPLDDYDDLNDMSVVVKMTYGKNTFLLTGDAEKKAENDLLEQYGAGLRAQVLKVGHHGSKTSTKEKFLTAVRPLYAAISAGDNDYDHPNPETLALLKRHNVTTYVTQTNGSIFFYSDGEKLEVTTER